MSLGFVIVKISVELILILYAMLHITVEDNNDLK